MQLTNGLLQSKNYNNSLIVGGDGIVARTLDSRLVESFEFRPCPVISEVAEKLSRDIATT